MYQIINEIKHRKRERERKGKEERGGVFKIQKTFNCGKVLIVFRIGREKSEIIKS